MSLERSFTIEQTSFFFDSYAFFEILKGNLNYKKYLDYNIITTKLNLYELYLGTLRESGEENAEIVFDKYFKFVIDFDEGVIKEAAKLKNKLNKRDVSMTDCIGYCLARQLNVPFLTGDNEFRDLEGVEFVK